MNVVDLQHEQKIDEAAHRVCLAVKQPECRDRFRALCELIQQRSPEAVREMELQKGLIR